MNAQPQVDSHQILTTNTKIKYVQGQPKLELDANNLAKEGRRKC